MEDFGREVEVKALIGIQVLRINDDSRGSLWIWK